MPQNMRVDFLDFLDFKQRRRTQVGPCAADQIFSQKYNTLVEYPKSLKIFNRVWAAQKYF
jgi:hypothetical protein